MDFAAFVERDRRQHDEVVVQQEIVVEDVLIPFQRYLFRELLRARLHSDRALILTEVSRNQGGHTSPDEGHLVIEGASFRPSVNGASIEADFEVLCAPRKHEPDVVSGFEPFFTDHRADDSAGSDSGATHVENVQPLSSLRQSLCCQGSREKRGQKNPSERIRGEGDDSLHVHISNAIADTAICHVFAVSAKRLYFLRGASPTPAPAAHSGCGHSTADLWK